MNMLGLFVVILAFVILPLAICAVQVVTLTVAVLLGATVFAIDESTDPKARGRGSYPFD